MLEIIVIILVGKVLWMQLSYLSLVTAIPSVFAVLVYNDLTPIMIKTELTGTEKLFALLMKWFVCFIYIVCTPLSVRVRGWDGGWGVVEPPTKFSERGVLTGRQLLEGVAGKEGGGFFQGGGDWVQFSHKKKIKN